MQVLEWTDTEKRLSTDHESQRHFQILKKKLDEWEPVKSGFRSKGKLMTAEGTSSPLDEVSSQVSLQPYGDLGQRT